VTDARGIIRHSTIPLIVGQARNDTYIFRHLSAKDDDGMIVDAIHSAGRAPAGNGGSAV